MFRFLRITTWTNGHRWFDVGGLVDQARVTAELREMALWHGEPSLTGATASEFIIYDGSC